MGAGRAAASAVAVVVVEDHHRSIGSTNSFRRMYAACFACRTQCVDCRIKYQYPHSLPRLLHRILRLLRRIPASRTGHNACRTDYNACHACNTTPAA